MKMSIFVGIVFVAAGSLGGFWYFSKKRAHTKTAIVTGADSWEDLKKAQGVAVTTHLNSPVGKAWKAKNFEQLQSFFGLNKKIKENRDFFQASIYVLDVSNFQWLPEDKAKIKQLQTAIVNYMIAKRDKPVVGEEAQVLSYASKTLLKFDSVADADVQALMQFYKTAANGNQKDLVLETVLRLNPMPAKAKKIVLEKIHSKTNPQESILILSQMKDADMVGELWEEVYKTYPTYPEAIKPLIFKQMVINRKYIKGDLKKYLSEISKSKSEDWQDAFLIGVREFNCLPEFRADVTRMQSETQYPQVRMMAKSILDSGVGVQ